MVAAIGTAAVSLTLGGLLLARGGGARSQARLQVEATRPAAAALPPVIEPVIAPTTPSSPAAAAKEEASGDDEARKPKSSHRHHGSHRQHAQSDRVARGLSIDPFKP